jgi:hypothetical protein
MMVNVETLRAALLFGAAAAVAGFAYATAWMAWVGHGGDDWYRQDT